MGYIMAVYVGTLSIEMIMKGIGTWRREFSRYRRRQSDFSTMSKRLHSSRPDFAVSRSLCSPFSWAGAIIAVALLLPVGKIQAIEKDVLVGVWQGPCAEGDFPANLATACQVVGKAVAANCQFLAFPECFLSGYSSREIVEAGARRLDDPAVQSFIADSSTHNVVILIGLARKLGDRLYNSVLVIHRGKLLGIYDKTMLTGYDRDALGFVPGTSVPVFQAHGAVFGVAICHDTSFPFPALAARLQGAEILFTPHFNEIAADRLESHQRWVRHCHIGLATQFKMAVARANIVKMSRPDQAGYGDSFVLAPNGEAVAEARMFQTGLITGRLTPELFLPPRTWARWEESPTWLRRLVGELLVDFRPPKDREDLRQWLEIMRRHRYRPAEISRATGLTLHEVEEALAELPAQDHAPLGRRSGEPLQILPYPGGRHPRIGFREGAVMPQRETKVSVFLPWDPEDYVVLDVPEAVFSNLGLIYLAHTHIPTVWEERGIDLPPREWHRESDGSLTAERPLPNGISFHTRVSSTPEAVHMEIRLFNPTSETLTGLRVQNCVHLKAAADFHHQTSANKVFQPPYAAVHSPDRTRWIITAWSPVQRTWGNDLVPCLHSDPQFPDCRPGETVSVTGWLSFYQGEDIQSEFQRIEATGWRRADAGRQNP